MRNGVADRIEFIQSNPFESVKRRFDLIIFDPPFRWITPRDLREMSYADENVKTMTAFFGSVKDYLTEKGRILIFYGDSGDLNYFLSLVEQEHFKKELMRSRAILKDGRRWVYYTWK